MKDAVVAARSLVETVHKEWNGGEVRATRCSHRRVKMVRGDCVAAASAVA